MEFCYSKLAAKMREIKVTGKGKRADADILPDNVLRRAMDGEQMPLDYALRVLQAYFSDDANAVDLFRADVLPEEHEALSFAESRRILDNVLLGEVMSDDEFLAIDAYLHDKKRCDVDWAIPAGYVVGHAAGVRSERARMRHKQGKEPRGSSYGGKLGELFEIVKRLSEYDLNFVTVTARTLLKIEEGVIK